MSTISQIGTYARYMGTVRTLTNTQTNVDDLTRQLTTGKKSTDLRAFGADTQQLLDLRAELVKRENYIQGIDTALPRLKATDTTMNALEKIASDWQTNNLLPFQPGPPSITAVHNANPDGMKVTVNADTSTFKQNSRFTVTAIPSQTAGNGSYDITVTDGLGGRTTRTINLRTVPPDDGKGYNFTMSGGPGNGAVVNLNIESLASASSSTFTVDFPQAKQTLDRVEGAMRDIRQYLNERFGDRFLFAGSRYGTEPVDDLLSQRQHSAVTLNGAIADEGDYYEVTVNDQVFSYTVPAGGPYNISAIATQLTSTINAASPALPVTVTTDNGVINLISQDPKQSFTVSARVDNRTIVDNSTDDPTTTTAPTLLLQQVDQVTLNGAGVDIGDTFEMTVSVGDPEDIYNRKYYNEYPDVPEDLPPYQEYKVSYTVTAADFQSGAVTSVSNVADRLRQQFAALSPAPPVTLDAAGSGPSIVLTSNNPLPATHVDSNGNPTRTSVFSTAMKVTNGTLANTVTVADLPPMADRVSDVPYVGQPNLPFYDTDYGGWNENVKAWDKSKVTADDGLSITYGVVSTDPAFQTLVSAFRMARAAAANPGDYDTYVKRSLELMSQAKDEMRSVHAKVASDLSTLEQKKTMHKEANNNVVERISKIEGIDETEVSARLRTAMNAQEAAYTVIGQTQKLSLLNYIA